MELPTESVLTQEPQLPEPVDSAPSQPSLPPDVERYVSVIASELAKHDAEDQPVVGVNEGLGVLAFAYEKVRNSVEYREEHVLLRAAIKRILKRRFGPMWNYEPVAPALVRELIWARYLANDSVPQQKVTVIDELLKKYAALYQGVAKMPAAAEWQDWLLGIAACDVEQTLVGGRRASYALAELMYQWLLNHLTIVDLSEDDRAVQLYLAVHRTLLKSDRALLTYHLFLLNVPEWRTMSEEQATAAAADMAEWRQIIDAQLEHPQAQQLSRAIKPYTPPFLVWDQIVRRFSSNISQRWQDWPWVKSQVQEICQARYAELHSRVRRAIIRSMIYILLTKTVLALLLEVPYDRLVYGEVHWPQLIANVLVPPILMAILGLSIRTPGPRNTEAIANRIKHVLDDDAPAETIALSRAQSSRAGGFSWFYSLTTLAIFGGLSWLLWRWDFSWLDIGLMLFFLCVVIFFAYRIRQIAHEFSVIRERENFFEATVTFLTLPFLQIGYRVSMEFGKVNLLAFFLDVLLEAPFKFILDVIEQWLDFVRRKQEEVVDRHEY